MEGPERNGQEYLLITGKDRVLPSVVVVGVALAMLVVAVVIAVRLDDGSGTVRAIMAVILAGVCFAVSWIVGAHVEVLTRWARWRRRAVPAMRLTEDGLDYSAAYTGTFPLHVPWSMVEGAAYRPDRDGHLFWCVDVHPAIVVEAMSESVLLRPVHPGRARATAIRLARTAAAHGEQVDVDLLTHALAFGTPVAINVHRVRAAPLDAVDEAVRRWSNGRCSLQANGTGP